MLDEEEWCQVKHELAKQYNQNDLTEAEQVWLVAHLIYSCICLPHQLLGTFQVAGMMECTRQLCLRKNSVHGMRLVELSK